MSKQAGGYLGAHGITQGDVAAMEEAESIFEQELGQYPESKLHPTIEFFPEEG